MVLKTITLKLHNPSKRKKEIIDKAMWNYSRAYQYLLDKAYEQIEDIRTDYQDSSGNYKAIRISKWVDKDISKSLNRFHVEPFKDSLKLDFGMTLASYLSLSQIGEDANYPMAYISQDKCQERIDNSIEQLSNRKMPLYEIERDIKKWIKKADTLKPLFFCRYDCNRDYCLLYDKDNDRYYAKIYLMNVKDENRGSSKGRDDKHLEYIHKKRGNLMGEGKRQRFIIFPLSFGKWQEEYLKKARDNPEILKTARLTRENGEYYLSINIAMEETAKIKPERYLGIGRALTSAAHYTVVDNNSEVISNGKIYLHDKRGYNNRKIPLNEIHRIANTIVDIAYNQKCQVVMKSLIDRGDKLKWENDTSPVIPVLSNSIYNQLAQILDYKLVEKGLPAPIRISPTGVFYTCPQCGLNTKKNRFSKDLFICTACGATMDIEELGSLNVASRLNCNSRQSIKIKMEKDDKGVRLSNKILGLDYYIQNSQGDIDGFAKEIQNIIEEFYKDIGMNKKNSEFKKKYSLIKKIQKAGGLNNIIQIV